MTRFPASAAACLLLGAGLSLPTPAPGQEWNSPRVLHLVADARDLRRSAGVDPGFTSYSSQARGYVYFFLDRPDAGERILVKTDQIALEVYWRAPNLTRQRIVGLRDRKSLPTNIRYHLDHLVVVQDEFGERIRIGDGDEVESVVHPVAPGSEAVYDFLLADSVAVILPGTSDTIRVYEILVRPRDFAAPGFVGSVFLDRETRAIVRMRFSFTPASYVDPYLDYIQISLENGLWLGKHWLPYRQQLEIRREVPYLDFPAGSVIQGWFEIRDYEINPDLPLTLFLARPVTALPEEARRSFPFEDSLYAHLRREGLRPPPEMGEIRSLALSLAGTRRLTGLRRSRLHLPSPAISSALRFNRAEGLFLGGGVSHSFHPHATLSTHGGYAFGRERPALALSLRGGEGAPGSGVEGYWNRPRDMGPLPAISGVLNTLSSLVLGEDYTDLYFTSGGRAYHRRSFRGGGRLSLEARLEEHRAAREVASRNADPPRFRAVLPAAEGTWSSLSAEGTLPLGGSGWTAQATGLFGGFQGEVLGALEGALSWNAHFLTRDVVLQGSLGGGLLAGTPPPQALYLLGGRETLPGHPFRSRTGDRYWLLRAEASAPLLSPWARLRIFGSAGGTGLQLPPPPAPWPQDTAPSPLFSAGAGLGLGWDILRLDLARGFREEGGWELILSVNRAFWGWL